MRRGKAINSWNRTEFESLFDDQLEKIVKLVEEGLDKFEKDGHEAVV